MEVKLVFKKPKTILEKVISFFKAETYNKSDVLLDTEEYEHDHVLIQVDGRKMSSLKKYKREHSKLDISDTINMLNIFKVEQITGLTISSHDDLSFAFSSEIKYVVV